MIHPSISLRSLNRLHQVTGAFPRPRHCLPSRQRCFITVTRARAKGQLGEQSMHLVSPLFGACGAGEGQCEAEGISKLVCLLDLCVTLCSLSVKSPSLPSYFFIPRAFLWPHPPLPLSIPTFLLLSLRLLFLLRRLCRRHLCRSIKTKNTPLCVFTDQTQPRYTAVSFDAGCCSRLEIYFPIFE